MDLAIAEAAVALLGAGERFALVWTLETSGSSPRHSGATMLVRTDGSILGTVGGGALEARAVRSALEVLEARASRLLDFELTNADSEGLGMICGGRGVLLVEHVDPAASTGPKLYLALVDLLQTGGTGWLVTAVSAAAGGAVTVERCLVDSAGKVTGAIAGYPACSAEALGELARMGGALNGHTGGDRPGIYVVPVGAPGTAYVFGAGHCGKSLVPLLSMVGFRTVIVDDRADFANPDRFPDAASVAVPDSFHDALASLPIDKQSYLVIMTRGHVFDRGVLAQALHTQACYIGMIGSKKKIAETFQALREQGFSDEDLARVHAPIGLDIGAETPEEIAVSIAGEIIQIRRSRSA